MATFDAPAFTSLLKKAIGTRTAKQFAAETGLSESYISRRMTGQFATPPRKNTLSAIASHAQNDVTLSQLLLTCGYEDNVPSGISKKAALGEIKVAMASIISSLGDLGVSCRINADETLPPYDFEVTLDADPPVAWSFSCVPNVSDELTIEQFLKDKYLSLMYSRLEAYSKISFVTGSRSVYSLCTARKPVNLNVNVSVILCAPDTLDVICEEALSESCTAPLPGEKCSFKKPDL